MTRRPLQMESLENRELLATFVQSAELAANRSGLNDEVMFAPAQVDSARDTRFEARNGSSTNRSTDRAAKKAEVGLVERVEPNSDVEAAINTIFEQIGNGDLDSFLPSELSGILGN